MKKKPTLQDIADQLNISKVSVSRALKGQNGVSKKLRGKIEENADKLGYSRASLHGTSNTAFFIFITPKRFFWKTEHFYTDIYYYLQRLCEQKKYRLMLQIIDPDMENAQILPNILKDASLTGIFIGGEISKEYLVKITELRIPTVAIDFFSTFDEFGHVTVDNFYLGYKAANFLIDKGHRQIGFVGQKKFISNIADRLMGIQKAMAESNLSFCNDWLIENHDHKTGLYSLDFHLPKDLPTAFICHCDRAAYFLMEKLKTYGISIPGNISILSFDDTETAQKTIPALTSFKIDRLAFAEKGIELMEKKLKNPAKNQERIYLNTQLVERESVRDLRGSRF